MTYLLKHAPGDGAGAPVVLRSPDDTAYPRPCVGTVYVQGALDGGTVTVEVSADGQAWHTTDALTLNAPGIVNLNVFAAHIRAVLSGSGPAADVSVILLSSHFAGGVA